MNAVGRKVVKDLVQKYHPHIFIIMEPHCQFSQVCIFWDKLGFAPMAVSEANGHLGGIWVLGVNGVSFSMVDCFPQVISLEVGVGAGRWVGSTVYGLLTPSSCEAL